LSGVLLLSSEFAVSLLDDAQLDTLLAREGDERVGLAEDKHVRGAGGKVVADGVLQVNDIEASVVFLLVLDDTDATQVASTGDHGRDSGLELHELLDLVGDEAELERVSGLDQGVGVADGSSVVGDEVRDPTHSDGDSPDFQEFELGFFARDSMDSESSFGIVEETEVFVGSFNSNDIHETSREFDVGTDFPVNLDET